MGRIRSEAKLLERKLDTKKRIKAQKHKKCKEKKLALDMMKVEAQQKDLRNKENLKMKVRILTKDNAALRQKLTCLTPKTPNFKYLAHPSTSKTIKHNVQTTHGQTTHGMVLSRTKMSRCSLRQECLLAIKTNIKSLPEYLDESSYDLVEDTPFQGSYGSIKLLRSKCTMTEVVAKSCSSSSLLEVLCEAKIMNLVSLMPYYPTFYGLLGAQTLVMENLGYRDSDGTYHVSTVALLQGLMHPQPFWVSIIIQFVKALMFLHDIGVLHNDIKSNNVIVKDDTLKIIDFGKATLKTHTYAYNLTPSQRLLYNKKHRYLAHELRNEDNVYLSELTDTYSAGYMIKYIGYYQKFNFLFDTGRKMKTQCPKERMDLSSALALLKNFKF